MPRSDLAADLGARTARDRWVLFLAAVIIFVAAAIDLGGAWRAGDLIALVIDVVLLPVSILLLIGLIPQTGRQAPHRPVGRATCGGGMDARRTEKRGPHGD